MALPAWARGAISAAAIALAMAIGAQAEASEWLRAESPHFVVYGDTDEKTVREYGLMLEDFDGLLRAMLLRGEPEAPEPKLTVYLLDDQSQMQLMQPSAGDQLVGLYVSATDEVFAMAIRGAIDDPRSLGDDTVLHEYTHHFVARHFPAAYPTWLNEGYAEYFATAGLAADKIKVGDWSRVRASTLLTEAWLPIAQLIGKEPGQLPADRQRAFYAEAWLLTHYLLSDPDRAMTLAGYLKGLEKGADPTASWVAAFGDPGALDKALQDYMNKPMRGSLWARTWATPKVAVAPVPAAVASVLLARRTLRRGVQPDEAKLARKAIKDAAAKYPDDPTVQTVAAIAESEFGDRAAANAVLDKLIAKDPANVEALRQRAINHIMVADNSRIAPAQREVEQREAARLLGLAAKVDPDSYQTLYWYVRSQQFEPGFPSQNTYNAMLKAVELAPQVTDVRVAAAQLAIMRKDVATAREMLAPVASDAHSADVAGQARRMLGQLAEQGRSGAGAGAP